MSTQPGPDQRTQAELLEDLRHGLPWKQRGALVRLTAVGEAEALDAVVGYMRDQPPGSSDVGLDALRVLANKYLPNDRYGLAEVLIPFLEADNWKNRLTATRLLSTHPNELATDALRNLIDETLDRLNEPKPSRVSPTNQFIEQTLAEAIMAFANCGRLIVLPEILELLEDPALRPVATRAIGLIGSETERLRLEDLCEDDDVNVRDAAQWALGLMDERIAQFTMPPDQIPEPPPDRLNPLYWAHRQLTASDDEMLQFLIVRVAIEHLLLDRVVSEGRAPLNCLIIVRRYEEDTPPNYRDNDAEIIGAWEYYWNGPVLRRLNRIPEPPTLAEIRRPKKPTDYGAAITISFPAAMPTADEGLVSFDCLFGLFASRGWIYHITRRSGEWTFSMVRRTWAG